MLILLVIFKNEVNVLILEIFKIIVGSKGIIIYIIGDRLGFLKFKY